MSSHASPSGAQAWATVENGQANNEVEGKSGIDTYVRTCTNSLNRVEDGVGRRKAQKTVTVQAPDARSGTRP